jgi:hypothetical protein
MLRWIDYSDKLECSPTVGAPPPCLSQWGPCLKGLSQELYSGTLSCPVCI